MAKPITVYAGPDVNLKLVGEYESGEWAPIFALIGGLKDTVRVRIQAYRMTTWGPTIVVRFEYT